ncbi:MAG: right-handed parallel beta-helix repeat-containing protein [Planctomycetota bacterium]|nr:right-handed parallel beta-helix repeat-containing protein [Planctomycetota bacterium]
MRSRSLTYVPLPGEQPEKSVVIAPRLERLVVVEGDVKEQRWVQYIHLRGLTFAHGNWIMPAGGQAFGQAEVNLDGAVSVIGGRNLVINGCAVRHVGGYAMAFGAGCRNNLVENCAMVDPAAGGVKIGHAGSSPLVGWVTENDPEKIPSHHTVRQCLIAHGGRMHAAGVGVWVAHSPHNVIEHNDIYDFYYTGISVGWTWGYGPSHTHHNDIGFNHVHTIGQGVLSDMGGIYTLGVSPGTRVHDNRFHDIQSYNRGYGGYGLYTDEGSTDIVMENNLVYRASSGGFHQHYGKENRIQNNIFAFGSDAQFQRTRPEPHTSFILERNIVYYDNANLVLGNNWWDSHFKLDYNVYWNSGAKPIRMFAEFTFPQWQQKFNQDQHSIIADPLFVAPEKDDFRLKEDSPTMKLGFKQFDASQAGKTTPPLLTRDLPAVPKAFE